MTLRADAPRFWPMWLALRWRWYRLESQDLIARNSNAITLAVLLLGPAALVLSYALAQLILTAVRGPVIPAMACAAAVQAATAAWSLSQSNAVRGAELATHVRSLPVPRLQLRTIDVMLLAASSQLLAFLLACSVAFAPWMSLAPVERVAVGLRMLALAGIVVCGNHGLVERRWATSCICICACALIPLSAHASSAGALVIGIVATAVAVTGVAVPDLRSRRRASASTRHRPLLTTRLLHPLLRVQLRALLAQPATFGRVLAAGALVWSATAFGCILEPGLIGWWLLMGTCAAATVLSAWHTGFREQRLEMHDVMAPLPVRNLEIALVDLCLVGCATAAVCIAPIFLAASTHVMAWSGWVAIPGSTAALMALQRPLRRISGAQAPIMMLGSWMLWIILMGEAAHCLRVLHG